MARNHLIPLDDSELICPNPAAMFQPPIIDGRVASTQQEYDDMVKWLHDLIMAGALARNYIYYSSVALRDASSVYWATSGVNGIFLNYYSDYTGFTEIPGPPTGSPSNIQYFYDSFSYNNGPSMGDAGVKDIATTWREEAYMDRFYLQRNELTSQQQTDLVNAIEREMLAGMGATSTGIFYIYLNSNSTGKNDVLDDTDLLANGWTVQATNRLVKTINGREVRVYHL